MASRYSSSQRHPSTARRALPPGWTIDGTELYQNVSAGGRQARNPHRLRALIERARNANTHH